MITGDFEAVVDELMRSRVALTQIHQQAADMTYRCACDGCRPAWSEVTRLARDASQRSATTREVTT